MNNIDSQSFIASQQLNTNNPELFNENTLKDAKKTSGSLKNKSTMQEKQSFLNLVLQSNVKAGDGKKYSKVTDHINKNSLTTVNSMQNLQKKFVYIGNKNSFTHTEASADVVGFVIAKKNLPNNAKQMIGSKDIKKLDVELCAFSTYKLSYIDRLSDKVSFSKITSVESAKNTMNVNEVKNILSSSLVDNDVVPGISVQNVINKYLEDIDSVESSTKVATAAHATQYEKYKISIIGEEKKTVLIRDYGNNLETK